MHYFAESGFEYFGILLIAVTCLQKKKNTEFKMVIVVRKDAKITKRELAVQVTFNLCLIPYAIISLF